MRGEKLEALYVLAVHTGMRQGELLALKWEDVDLNEGVIRTRRTLARSRGQIALGEPMTKGGRRTVHLTGAAVEALRNHLERQLEEIERLGDLYRDVGSVPGVPGGPLMLTSEGGGGYHFVLEHATIDFSLPDGPRWSDRSRVPLLTRAMRKLLSGARLYFGGGLLMFRCL